MKQKFRAWLRNEKKFVYFHIGDWEIIKEIQEVENEVTRYTGKRDSKGQEIYEGDVVLSKRGLPPDLIDLHSIVAWNDAEAGFIYVSKAGEEYLDEFVPEIIGNIFESPELMPDDFRIKKDLKDLEKELGLDNAPEIRGVTPFKIMCKCGEVKYMQEHIYSKEEHIELETNTCNKCVKRKEK